MSTFADQLLSAQQQPNIHHAEIFRLLSRHPIWFIPAREGQPLLQQHQGQNHLHIYSTDSYLQEHHHDGIESIEFTSTWLFNNLPPVQSIIIDGHTEHALQIPDGLFDSLTRMTNSLHLETILETQAKDDSFLNALKEFEGYYLPLVQDANGQNHVALAPDHQQRALVAVFTAEDAAHRFIQAAADKLDNLQMDIVDGTKLFHHLDMLSLDGMVLNCYGPTQPVALNKSTISALASVNRL